jgi:hypothetical protein
LLRPNAASNLEAAFVVTVAWAFTGGTLAAAQQQAWRLHAVYPSQKTLGTLHSMPQALLGMKFAQMSPRPLDDRPGTGRIRMAGPGSLAATSPDLGRCVHPSVG